MIDISGDIIYFDGRPVGFITVPNGSLRGAFEEALSYDASDEIAHLNAQLRQTEDDLGESLDRIREARNYARGNDVSIDEIIKILS